MASFEEQNIQNALASIAEASIAKDFFAKKKAEQDSTQAMMEANEQWTRLATQLREAGVKPSDFNGDDPSMFQRIQLAMLTDATSKSPDSNATEDKIKRLFDKDLAKDDPDLKEDLKTTFAELQPTLSPEHRDFLATVAMKELENPGFLKELKSRMEQNIKAEKTNPELKTEHDKQMQEFIYGTSNASFAPNSEIAKELTEAMHEVTAEEETIEVEEVEINIENAAEENYEAAESNDEIEEADAEEEQTAEANNAPAAETEAPSVAEFLGDIQGNAEKITAQLEENNVKTYDSPQFKPPGMA